jgi:predicted nucleotidyltransferase
MDKKQVINKIKDYIKALIRKNIKVEKVYLFGSYAHGNAKTYSDIDVAVISPDFGKSYLEETRLLMKIARDVDLMISPDPYSVEEFNNAKQGDFLWQEIIKKGKLIEI